MADAKENCGGCSPETTVDGRNCKRIETGIAFQLWDLGRQTSMSEADRPQLSDDPWQALEIAETDRTAKQKEDLRRLFIESDPLRRIW